MTASSSESASPRFNELANEAFDFHASMYNDLITEDLLSPDHSDMLLDGDSAKTLGTLLIQDRQKIRDHTPEQADHLRSTFLEHAPPYIRYLIAQACENLNTKTGTVDHTLEDNLATALTHQFSNRRYALSNKSFLNVVEWHTDYLDRKMNRLGGETETESQYKEEYEQKYEHLITLGVLPVSARKNLMLVHETPIMHDPQADPRLLGYYTHHRGAVLRTQTIGTVFERGALFHELTHAASQTQIDTIGDITLRSAFEPFEDTPGAASVFREGMTEYVTAALLGDEYPKEHDVIYPDYRNLIVALCETSGDTITAHDFVEAYFETDKASNLKQKLLSTFGSDILRQIDNSDWRIDGYGLVSQTLRSIVQDLYVDWVSKTGRTTQEIEQTADRILAVSSRVAASPHFLRDTCSKEQ